MPLTPEEQKELEALEAEFAGESSGLSAEEEAELAALEKEFGEPGQAEAAVRGAAEGASLGFYDEIVGAVNAPIDVLTSRLAAWAEGVKPEDIDAPSMGDAYTQHRDEARTAQKTAEKAHPGTFTAGQVAGGIGSMLVPGGAAAKGVASAGKLAKGATAAGKLAGTGALAGMGSSEATDVKGIAQDAASGAGTALATGGALKGLGAAGKGLGKLAKTGSEQVQKRALGLTGRAGKQLGRENVQDATKLARQHEILTGDKLKTVDRANQALRTIGTKFDDLWSKYMPDNQPQFNPQNVAQRIDNEVTKATKYSTGPDQQKIVTKLVKNIKQIRPDDVAELSNLKRQIGESTQKGDDVSRALYGKVYSIINDEIEKKLSQSAGKLGPEAVKELRSANKQYRLLKTIRDQAVTKEHQAGTMLGRLQDVGVGGALAAGGMAPYSIPAIVGSALARKYGPTALSRIQGVLERGGPAAEKMKKLIDAGNLSDVAAMVAVQKTTGE